MCGIAGIFHFPASPGPVPGALAGMLQRMVARGPDGSGTAADGDVELGHRRLAILDLSDAGSQPMTSACGRFVVSFNGEIYNHLDLARETGLDPARLRSRTDTEVLLEAWARHGTAVLPRLVGQFAFAVHDRRERCVWLVRDRFGEKPLFHHADRERFTFASSIPALLAAPWIRKALDPEALVEYLTLRYVVGPRTVLEGIRKLPPGHLMRIDRDGATRERWYRLPLSGRRHGPLRAADVDRFGELLGQATRRCLMADVPVALFLSDGIDSHGIAASGGGAIPSFSYRAHEGSVQVGDVAAGHTVVEVSNRERMTDLDAAFASLTEPVGDGVALATWQLVRRARAGATVFLCGHGGDEILGGYRLNRDLLTLRALHALRALPSGLLGRLFPRMVQGPEPLAERVRRIRAATRAGTPDAARHLIHRPLPMDDLRELLGPAASLAGCMASVDRLYGELGEAGEDLDRIQAVMTQTFLTDNLCSFSDAVGMASSAEIRMPYLDRDLVEFVMACPADHRAKALPFRSATKRLLRHWARGRVPDDVIGRKKRGFASGRITHLLEQDEAGVRARILDVGPLREAVPGLESWMSREMAFYRGGREGTFWAVLALAVWYAALDDPAGLPAPVGPAVPAALRR